MSRIRTFVQSRINLKPAPAFFVLVRTDELDSYSVVTVDASNVVSTVPELERALREDLASVPAGSTANYVISAQGAGGENLGSQKLPGCKGLGNAGIDKGDLSGGISKGLVALVQETLEATQRMTTGLFDRQEKTIGAQAGTIDRLTGAVLQMAETLGSPPQEDTPNPVAQMAADRARALLESGFGAAMMKLGMPGTQAATDPAADGITPGKHVELREFIALHLTDAEIDRIWKVAVDSGLASQFQECLTAESLGALMTIIGG